MEKYIIVNGQKLTLKEFEERRNQVKKSKGMELVEIAPGQFKVRMHS